MQQESLGVRLLVIGSLVVLLSVTASAQERVAQLTSVTGTVEIRRAGSDRIDLARQLGPRVRNGSVFAEDVISTGAASSATIVFSDGSELQLAEQTSLSIREGTLPTAAATGHQTVGRTIKVLAGKVLADIVPGGTVATEFETPSGVAAVKGTKLTVEVGDPRQSIDRCQGHAQPDPAPPPAASSPPPGIPRSPQRPWTTEPGS